MTAGKLIGIDTSTFAAGQLVYLGSNGTITGTPAVAPANNVRLGQILRVQGVNGSMYVKPDNGYELEELHNVSASLAPTGSVLAYNGTVWYPTLTPSITASYALTASYVETAQSSSYFIMSNYATNNYADDTTAAAGGVPLGGVYRSGNMLLVRIS